MWQRKRLVVPKLLAMPVLLKVPVVIWQLDGTNYKRKVENDIDEYPNRRILFVCTRKYADRILWLIQGEISRQNGEHNRSDEFNYGTFLEMGLQGHKKKMAHMM
ncbi:hypothetical protein QL285_061372 [Trifolium repens]|nr:hypothetical protein QL285_061372 [Trifolium repens]